MSWSYNTPGQWFGGSVESRAARDMSNFRNGTMKLKIKIPANVAFTIGVQDTYTNQNSVKFPANATTYGLVQACSEHRRVRIDYRSEAGSEWLTEVEPWAVVVRHGRWYLLCRTHPKGARRAYRVDRVRGVEVLDDTFSPPADLDPVAMLEENLAAGWEYDVEIVVDAPVEVVGRCVPRTLGRLEPLDAETSRLVGSTSNPWWYAEQLAALPASYRIVGGPELRGAARAVGRRMLAAAGDAGP